MDHRDHVNLLRDGVPSPGGIWADFGSGRGAFTLALAELIGPEGEIYSVDRDAQSLRNQERAMQALFPERQPGNTRYILADFTRSLNLPPLEGIVMANALHFQKDQDALVQLLQGYLRPGGRFILVEYNLQRRNPWVPHPIPYQQWQVLARRTGFIETRLLARRPSRTFGEIYSALSLKSTFA